MTKTNTVSPTAPAVESAHEKGGASTHLIAPAALRNLRSGIITLDNPIIATPSTDEFNINITEAARGLMASDKAETHKNNALVLIAHRQKVDVSENGDGSEMKMQTVAATVHTMPTLEAFNAAPEGKKLLDGYAVKALLSKLTSALGSDSPTPVTVADYAADAQRGDPMASKMLANLAKQAAQLRVYEGMAAINDRTLRKALMSAKDAAILFPEAVAAVPDIFKAVNNLITEQLITVERTDANSELLDYMLAQLATWAEGHDSAPATVEVKVKSLSDLMAAMPGS